MSPSTHTPLDRLVERAPVANRHDLLAATRATAFWVAVCLPLVYGQLLWGGLTGGEVPIFLALLVANVGALLLGHDHRSETAAPPRR